MAVFVVLHIDERVRYLLVVLPILEKRALTNFLFQLQILLFDLLQLLLGVAFDRICILLHQGLFIGLLEELGVFGVEHYCILVVKLVLRIVFHNG